jgi:hypothetical protein
MITTKKLKTLKEKVEILLTKFPELRDDDKLLVTKMWFYELKKYEVEPTLMSAMQFFEIYQQNVLSNSDLITRSRRKIQEENPNLRGKTWDERHKEGEETRFDIIK